MMAIPLKVREYYSIHKRDLWDFFIATAQVKDTLNLSIIGRLDLNNNTIVRYFLASNYLWAKTYRTFYMICMKCNQTSFVGVFIEGRGELS